jgi:hypothetical protein
MQPHEHDGPILAIKFTLNKLQYIQIIMKNMPN